MEIIIREAQKEEIEELNELDEKRIIAIYDNIKGTICDFNLKKQSPTMLAWTDHLIKIGDFEVIVRSSSSINCFVASEDGVLIGFILVSWKDYSQSKEVKYNSKGVIEKLYVSKCDKTETEEIKMSLLQEASEWFEKNEVELIEYINISCEDENHFYTDVAEFDHFETVMIYELVDPEVDINALTKSQRSVVRIIESNNLTKTDGEGLAKLRTSFIYEMSELQPEYVSPLPIAPEIKDSQIYLVFEYDNTIEGYAILEKKGSDNFCNAVSITPGDAKIKLDELYVDKEFRKYGVGRSLILEAKKWCERNKISYLELDVHFNNERAMPLYQKENFIPILEKWRCFVR